MSSGSMDLGTTSGSFTPSGAAGGDLTGNYPNPTIAPTATPTIAALNVNDTTPLSIVGSVTAGVNLGTAGAGGSVLVNTPSLSSSFQSGLAVDGSFSSPTSTVNLYALNVDSPGGYASELNVYTKFETTLIKNLRLNADATTNSFGGIIISTVVSRPTAGAAYRGMIYVQQGAAGVADQFQICLKSAADTYSWKNIISG